MSAPPRHHRLLAIVILVLVMLIWPVYALVPAVYPFVLGLPFGFAWLVFCILIAFAALLATFRADMRAARAQGRSDEYPD
ncbi:MAG TPA: hypothetical protein VFK12_04155 [Gammaproteobacteria bacterium]|jgi:hypothetical protein|nr:hypothetical protein [Gammaproteobacteria bacterium]